MFFFRTDYSNDELARLQDYEVIMVIQNRIQNEVNAFSSEEDVENYPEHRFLILALSSFNMEMQNGGLYQFFMNDGLSACIIYDALKWLGADAHADLFGRFCQENNIDPTAIDSGEVSVEKYLEMLERHPYQEFDEAYYAIDRKAPLESLLAEYIRNHLDQF